MTVIRGACAAWASEPLAPRRSVRQPGTRYSYPGGRHTGYRCKFASTRIKVCGYA